MRYGATLTRGRWDTWCGPATLRNRRRIRDRRPQRLCLSLRPLHQRGQPVHDPGCEPGTTPGIARVYRTVLRLRGLDGCFSRGAERAHRQTARHRREHGPRGSDRCARCDSSSYPDADTDLPYVHADGHAYSLENTNADSHPHAHTDAHDHAECDPGGRLKVTAVASMARHRDVQTKRSGRAARPGGLPCGEAAEASGASSGSRST